MGPWLISNHTHTRTHTHSHNSKPLPHTHACRFSVAAGVYNALATRLSGSGDAAVTLEERLQALQDALMQVLYDQDQDQDGLTTATQQWYISAP